MYVNIAVLTETLAHERRFGMVPAVAAHLQKLGGRLHMQPRAGAAEMPEEMRRALGELGLL